MAYQAKGDVKAAVAEYRQVLTDAKTPSDRAWAHLGLAEVYRRAGDARARRAALQAAAEADPTGTFGDAARRLLQELK